MRALPGQRGWFVAKVGDGAKCAVATLAIDYGFFVVADEGAGATGLISGVVTTCLCQCEPKKYGDG